MHHFSLLLYSVDNWILILSNLPCLDVYMRLFLSCFKMYIDSGAILLFKLFFVGVVCLDGTLPGYHLDRGYGSGANSWLIQLEVRAPYHIETTEFHS